VPAVLIIDDSETLRELTREAIERSGLFDRVLTAGDGFSGFRRLATENPDLVLCDLNMPNGGGRTFLELRRAQPRLHRIPVILLTSDSDAEHKADLLEAGAADYVVRPFHPRELVARVRVHLRLKIAQEELASLNERLVALSNTDPVTELMNRRALDESLAMEVSRACRYGTPLSLALLDIDHFKRINDTYGHGVGDEVLHAVARIVRHDLRKTDVAARFGGEEFVVVLPHTDLPGASLVAERIRTNVRRAVHRAGSSAFSVTASLGVACMSDGSPSSSTELFARADAALYDSKRQGRDRVTLAAPTRVGSQRPTELPSQRRGALL
jgi:diguanylate cyclase (GGDEF)-like protein